MEGFSRREQVLIALLVLVAATGIGINFFIRGGMREIEGFKLERGPVKAVSAPVSPPALQQGVSSKIVVHVSGAVKNPGIYEFAEGDRWADAVQAAGGPTGDADVDALNLALRLRDEDKIYVPRLGEDTSAVAVASQLDDGKVNINIADKAKLETLPGIGEVLAQRIIDYREKNGGFKTVEEITQVSGIGDSKFESMKDLIKVK